jgi:2-oxoglutarate dehydrogenase complex dehydrogenase (E1) component-like enzyme
MFDEFGINAGYVEELHALYRQSPLAVDPKWRAFFESDARFQSAGLAPQATSTPRADGDGGRANGTYRNGQDANGQDVNGHAANGIANGASSSTSSQRPSRPRPDWRRARRTGQPRTPSRATRRSSRRGSRGACSSS